MRHFTYRAYDKGGMERKGVIEADGQEDAARRLSGLDLKPSLLKEVVLKGSGRYNNMPARRDRIDFVRLFSELHILLQAGFTIDVALKTATGGLTHPRQRERLQGVSAMITKGSSVANAFSTLPEAPANVAALLESGEQSGKLSDVIGVLATSFQDGAARRKELVEQLIYPAFLVLVMMAALAIITFVLVPAVSPIFDDRPEAKPLLIGVLSTVRQMVLSNGDILAGILVAILVTLMLVVRNDNWRGRFFGLVLNTPLIGKVVHVQGIAGYMRILSLMIENQVPIKRSLELAASACPIEPYRLKLSAMSDAVASGSDFSSAARATELFDGVTVSLIELGDAANNLPQALRRAAFLKDSEGKQLAKRVLLLLTPTITIAMGLVIGGLVVSVMDALMSINSMAIQ